MLVKIVDDMNTSRLFAHCTFFEYILKVLRCVCSVTLPSCTAYTSHVSHQEVTRQGLPICNEDEMLKADGR